MEWGDLGRGARRLLGVGCYYVVAGGHMRSNPDKDLDSVRA